MTSVLTVSKTLRTCMPNGSAAFAAGTYDTGFIAEHESELLGDGEPSENDNALAIALAGVYFATLLDKVLSRLKMDRRQVQSLHTVAHVTVRVVAVLLILLVIFGPPGQLGTFLGLATAGLTVGLKDFIVGFIGWFVLMGKNGIRLGDWVEINGVTGEVVEIGPFHTVLLETGNWTDSGHPTGRRSEEHTSELQSHVG